MSNHPILGLDFPVLLSQLYSETGIFLRALTDKSHWQIPINASVMRDVVGAVEGTQRNVDLLMEAGQPILVCRCRTAQSLSLPTLRRRPNALVLPPLLYISHTCVPPLSFPNPHPIVSLKGALPSCSFFNVSSSSVVCDIGRCIQGVLGRRSSG